MSAEAAFLYCCTKISVQCVVAFFNMLTQASSVKINCKCVSTVVSARVSKKELVKSALD